ncbi:MAG: tail fiber domain-containing protein [Candidatus Zixiibacteriota bacterium]
MALDKISELPITKWNYKGDTKTEHIGPTAQDFQETFGVGSDGKSISTIDPPGIALAGIKALSKQNRELQQQNRDLQKQNADLKKQMEDLARKVEELAAGR